MNRKIAKYSLYLWLLCSIHPDFFIIQNVHADELGRLFTTKAVREMLDNLRYATNNELEPIVVVIEEPEEPEEIKPEIGGITVNGLVYRKGGKSTAWINNANTFEGNLGNQYIQVNADDIDPESVQIQMSGSVTDITLKVGETYDTATEKIIDLTDTYTER